MTLTNNTLFANRFILRNLLGRGGFSEVWLASDSFTNLEVAIKIYAPGQGMDENGMKDFCKELSQVYDLNHQNLLKPQHVDSFEGMPYLVMTYCQNGSCKSKIGSMLEEDVWKLIADVAAGLAYLHERNIIHQDIKPDNILIDNNGNYVITDFGISVKVRSTLRKSMNVQSSTSGTTAYMGPERFSKNPQVIPASDIWSLGATVYELITGKVPFGEMGGGMQFNGAELPTIHANISSSLKQVLAKMLAEEPSQRPVASLLVDWAQNPDAIQLVIDSEPEENGSIGMLKVSPSYIEAKPVGQYATIKIKTSNYWKFFYEPSKWLDVKKEGDGLLIHVKPNQSGITREHSINVIAGARAATIRVSQESLPKSKAKTWVTILCIVVAVAIVTLIGNLIVHHKKQMKREAIRMEIVAKLKSSYEHECKMCEEHIRLADDDFFFTNFVEIVRDLREIESMEKEPPFIEKKIQPRSKELMKNFQLKARNVLDEIDKFCQDQRRINPSDKNIALQAAKRKSTMLNNLIQQSLSGSAFSIKLPEDKEQTNNK